MTPGEARTVLERDAADLLHCSPEVAAFYVSAIADRLAAGMPQYYVAEWLAVALGERHPAAQPGFVDAICRGLDAPVPV